MTKKRGAGGRPTKLTPELQEELVKVIRAGNYIETACAYVGINKTTFYDWMKRGAREKERLERNTNARPKKSEATFVELSNAIEKALAQAEIRDVAIIGKAAEENWQAAAWRLERKFPERWGKKSQYHNDEEERSLKLEQLRLLIEKTKAETEKITSANENDTPPIINIVDEWSDNDE